MVYFILPYISWFIFRLYCRISFMLCIYLGGHVDIYISNSSPIWCPPRRVFILPLLVKPEECMHELGLYLFRTYISLIIAAKPHIYLRSLPPLEPHTLWQDQNFLCFKNDHYYALLLIIVMTVEYERINLGANSYPGVLYKF